MTYVIDQKENHDTAQNKLFGLFNKYWHYVIVGLIFIIFLLILTSMAKKNVWDIGVDGLSYLQISREYANGNFVVRGQWGPLISWMTVPFIWLGKKPELAMRMSLVIHGVFWWIISVLLAKRLGLNEIGIILYSIVIAIFIAGHSSNLEIRTEPLNAAINLLYYYVLLSPKLEKHAISKGIIIGIIVSFAFFARSYNLPFFLVHISLTALIFILQGSNWKKIVITLVTSVITFFVIISPWIWLLSNRYGTFTYSTSSAVNRALTAPGGEGPWNVCISGVQLCDQPEDVLFPWEDHLASYLPKYGWSPFNSIDDFKYQISLFFKNAKKVFFSVNPILVGSQLLILLIFLLKNQPLQQKKLIFILVTGCLYSSGYFLMYDIARYHYITISLFFVGIVMFLEISFSKLTENLSKSTKAAGLTILVVLVTTYTLQYDNGLRLLNEYSQDSRKGCIVKDTEIIKPFLVPPLAATDTIGNHYQFPSALDISYHTQTRYVGSISPSLYSSEEMHNFFQSHNVNTVITDPKIAEELELLFGYENVVSANICGEETSVLRISSE